MNAPGALLGFLFFSSSSVLAECEPWLDGKAGDAERFFVGNIEIETQNVFDESIKGESGLLHRASNRFHRVTSKNVIRKQLLVKKGDLLNFNKLQETERLLRKNRYIRYARVEPFEVCNTMVNIRVTTSDNWSLVPAFSFGRAGGVNKSSYAIKDSNLFGKGKFLEFKVENGFDRDETLIRYIDPQLFGGRKRVQLRFQDNSDGESQFLGLEQPFYSRESRNAWGISAGKDLRVEPLFLNGEINRQIGIDQKSIDVFTGRASLLSNGSLIRRRVGFRLDQSDFVALDGFPEGTIIEGRNYAMPYFSVNWDNRKYIEGSNYRTMEAVEDLFLGTSWNTKIGLSNRAFGGTENSVLYESDVQLSHQINEHTLGQYYLGLSGEVNGSRNRNTILKVNGEWFFTQSRKRKLYFNVSAEFGNDFYDEKQLVLGGDTGLRGYPIRFQSGENRVRASVEQRWYFDWYPLRVVRAGAAVFADVGSAWGGTGNERNLIRNVGVGLRLIPTRQSSGQVLHLDIAFPLDRTQEISTVQLILNARREF